MRLVQFGSIALPSTFAPAEDSLARDIQAFNLPRADGARVIQGYATEKIIPVRGMLVKGPISNISPYNDLRTAVDALRENLAQGLANLYFWDDWYYRDVQARSVSISYVEKRYDSMASIDIEFVTGDPFAYSESLTTDTWVGPTNGASRVITPLGNAYTPPIYKFDVGGLGSQTISWAFTNNTSGKSFTLSGSVTGGQVIEVDTRAKTVVIGTTDKMSLFDGQFPELLYTANSLQVGITSGSIASIRSVYRSRRWG